MAYSSYSAAPILTNGDLYYKLYHPISAFMTTAGWVQGSDTGQIVWPSGILNVTTVTNSAGTHEVYTSTLDDGTYPQAGSSVIINGCTTGGLNTTAIVTAVNGTTSFTIANTSATTETETAGAAWASVNPQVTISSLTVSGGVITFTFGVFDGTIRAGESIVVTGTTGATYDGTYTITSVVGSTFTAATTAGNVGATAETAIGIVTCNPAVVSTGASTTTMPTTLSHSLYEIWKMGDGNSQTIYMRLNYGSYTTNTIPLMAVGIAATTDGAGNLTGGNTGMITAMGSNASSATAQTSYMTGASNRICLGLFIDTTTTPLAACLIAVERSHDSSGNDTTSGQYATLAILGHSAGSLADAQVSISAANVTQQETKLAAFGTHNTTTGTFIIGNSGSTILSPIFPLVGAIGNPMYGVLIGKVSDWVDLTQFSFTMYNTARNYIVFNAASSAFNSATDIVYDGTPTLCPIMLYQ